MRRLALVLLAGVAVAGAAQPTTAAPIVYVLHGSVASGHITLKGGTGQPFTEGRPDLYRISVTDSSPTDDFRLVGPGVNVVITSVSFVGARSVQVTLERGTYHYRSDPHRTTMKGSFIID